MRLWFEQNRGIPRRGDKSPGFDMGMFWSNCSCGLANTELFAAALLESPEMKAAHKARLEGKAARAELPPAKKMQKMRQWFEQNDGTPRFDDSTAGFNMGKFWQTCCSRGYHKELFTAALAESSKMKEAHEARLNKKNMNTLLRGLRHRQASSDESDSDDDVLLSALRRPKGDEGEGKLPPPPAEKMEQDWSSR